MGSEVPYADIDRRCAQHGRGEVGASHKGKFQSSGAVEGFMTDVVR
jgi:hypothetical protein